MHVAVGNLHEWTRVSEVHEHRFGFALGVSLDNEDRKFAQVRITQEFKFLKFNQNSAIFGIIIYIT